MIRLAALILLPAVAWADAWHGSVAGGSSLLVTGSGGDRLRFDLGVDLKPGSRYGISAGWRSFDGDHRGLLTGGLVFEAGAARPRLVIDLHADVGVDLDDPHPVIGAGIRTTLGVLGPLALIFDATPWLVLGGYDALRLQLTGSLLLALRW